MTLKHFRIAAAALALALAVVGGADAQKYPHEPGSGIADLANVLSAAEEDSIRNVLHGLRSDPGVEVRVLTIPSLASQNARESTVPEFATAVYNYWNLGYGQKQDGVLVLLSVADREARIELGDGVPASQDERMQRVMDERMVPRFRDGDMSGGMLAGVVAIAESFRDPTTFTTSAPAPSTAYEPSNQPSYQPAYEAPASGGGDDGIVGGILTLLGLGGAVAWYRSYRRRRPRPCRNCRTMMVRLDESSDDVHLDSGRRLEEAMGSVDYDAWSCPGCSNTEVIAYPSMLSGKERCPDCSYRTVEVRKSTLEAATYTSEGLQLITRDCRHCSYHDEDTIRLPRLQRTTSSSGTRSSSSSSSGSGSSFSGGGGGGGSSGGHSSGRGASGKW